MDNRRSWKGQLSLKESDHRRYSDSEEHKSKTSETNNSGKKYIKLKFLFCILFGEMLFKIKVNNTLGLFIY
jgi:hypothetical protein